MLAVRVAGEIGTTAAVLDCLSSAAIVPRQGTFVTQLTARDVVEIFDMRLMIEMYAAETILDSGTAAQFLDAVSSPMQAMEQAIDGDVFRDYEAFTTNDRAFHTALITLTGNQRLIRAYTQLHIHTHGARVHYLNNDNARQSHNEHQAIVAAFCSENVDQVKAALRVHIASVKAWILEQLDQRGGKL